MLLPSQSNGGFAQWMEIKRGMWIFHSSMWFLNQD
jgi:hypothetical protein